MRLLVVDEELPYPLDSGKKIRTHNLVRNLAAKHAVRYLAFRSEAGDDEERVAALSELGIACHLVDANIQRKSGPQFYAKLAANLFSPLPYIVASHTRKAFADRLANLIREDKPDLILAEWTPYANYLLNLRDVIRVGVAHNIESTIWRRYYDNESNPFKRWFIGVQAGKIESFETRAFRALDGMIAVSPTERDKIATRSGGRPTELVDNGVDETFFTPLPGEVEPHSIAFVGSMDWRPNQDAAEHLVHDIFPRLKLLLPAARCYLVGRNPPRHIRQLATEDILVTGSVPDVRQYVARARVAVVPLRIGGGTRLKILEAMAMAKPVVSTTIGAEGLEVGHERDILIADSAEEFARACARVMEDAGTADALAQAGRELIMKRYRWETISARMDEFLRGLSPSPNR